VPDVTVNGVRLYYEERGTGAPILGIHGGGSSALVWETAAAKLAGLGRMVIYDRRGCTRSERPEPYEMTSVREHADDARELLAALDAEPAVVIGRSYGGTVGLDLALRHPESVRALVLLEPGHTGISAEYDAWFAELAATAEGVAAERGIDAVAEAVLRDVFGGWEEFPEAFRDVYTANGPALLAEIRGGEKLTDNALLGELRTPTLIVSGEDSPEPLQHATVGLERALPQARTARVAGGHMVDPAGRDVLEFVADALAS
jgi:pimeloyl-ACP methyl ester carboxylesterase